MSIRFAAWNIQNLGEETNYANIRKGVRSAELAQFIGSYVAARNIDILGIMEVQPTAQPHLNAIQAAIVGATGNNDSWCYDWIKGSVVTQPPPANITTPLNLIWASGISAAREEGYAFFWKDNHPEFSMVTARARMSFGVTRFAGYAPAYQPANTIALSLQGRDFTPPRSGRIRPNPRINYDPQQPAAGFVDAYFPDTSKQIGSWQIFWEAVRRPCYCVIELNNPNVIGDAALLIPLLIHHAPSNQALSKLSTFIAGLSFELYSTPTVVNHFPQARIIHQDKTIAAGDFNASATLRSTFSWYRSFRNPFNLTAQGRPDGGADCTALYTDAAPVRTTVQIKTQVNGLFNGPPIMMPNNADYLFSPIDNMFYRGLTLNPNVGANFFVDNLLDLVRANPSPVAAGVRAYLPLINQEVVLAQVFGNGVDPVRGPLDIDDNPVYPFMQDWAAAFHPGVTNGTFGTARSAAEFVRMFVSDHLPLIVDFEAV